MGTVREAPMREVFTWAGMSSSPSIVCTQGAFRPCGSRRQVGTDAVQKVICVFVAETATCVAWNLMACTSDARVRA
jgi:hypothetical protein